MKCAYEVNTETNKIGNVNITLESTEELGILTLALVSLKASKENIVSLLSDSSESKQYEIAKLNKINEMIAIIDRPETEVIE